MPLRDIVRRDEMDAVTPNGGPSPSPTPVVRSTGVTRTYETRKSTVEALGQIDLEIAEGEFVCIVGPSGCGKSTFLRIIAGLINPTSGTVEIADQGRGGVLTSMVFQDYSIYPWKTVEENVRFGLDVAGKRRSDSKEAVDWWLRRLGLADFRKAYPAALSGGMRQRVSIARALVVEPQIILMDEPFAALDAQLRTLLQEELLSIWQQFQRTVVFVTHSIDEALLLGDRILVMSARPGRILADIRVPFERPRKPELRGVAEFADLEQHIWSMLRHEVDGGRGADANETVDEVTT